MTSTEENHIVARVLAGEREAFAALVDAYKGVIFNLAYRMTNSHQDADDLAQETFVRAFRKLGQFDQRQQLFTWLYTISLNLIRNHLKKHERERVREKAAADSLVPAHAQTSHGEQSAMQSQELSRLESCLQQLPTDLREAVVLRFYQDLPFEEIATISGASLSTVKMRVYRGIEQLKKLMQIAEE